MTTFHKNLTEEKWQKLPFFAQMSNIGAEVGRAINWKKEDKKLSNYAFLRSLDLLDLTISDIKNKKHLKELCRLKEFLVDYFYCDNIYGSDDQKWNSYFYGFNYASAINNQNSNA